MSFSLVNILGTMPEIYLTFFGCVILILDTMIPNEKRSWLAYFTIASLIFAMIASYGLNGKGLPLYQGLYIIDPFSNFFKMIIYVAAIITILFSLPYLDREDIHIGEYYAFILFSTVGMMVMVSAGDLITLFLGIELMSLCFYVMVGLKRGSHRSVEASFKYFLLGAFSAAIFLFGISFLYGATGTETISGIAAFVANPGSLKPMVLLGIVLTLVGFAFKISAAPFHMWTPDVYEGAPTVVTGFMATASKIAAFGVFLRVFWVSFSADKIDWNLLIIILSVLSMLVGNLVALRQTNIKRMLAYSSIGHAGYASMALLQPNRESLFALMFYVFVYMFMTLGAFGIVLMLRKSGEEGEEISDLVGLYKRHPIAAFTMLVFMFSLAGIPPFGGFLAKFYIFFAVIHAGYAWLAVVGIIFAAIGAFYYLRIVMLMYMKDPEASVEFTSSSMGRIGLLLTAGMTVFLGVYPTPFVEYIKSSLAIFIP
ncbi:MAG: NADH-quinone oxidoreductase subunit N [Leptospirillum sp.]|jgi:NADH-quinone oxidoreductase subunit N